MALASSTTMETIDSDNETQHVFGAKSGPIELPFWTRTEFKIFLFFIYTFVFATNLLGERLQDARCTNDVTLGNSLVIAVVSCRRRMRSATNFFLTNLAAADLMVAAFCIYQNLSLYILDHEWAFGSAMCKLYHFTNAFAYTGESLHQLIN